MVNWRLLAVAVMLRILEEGEPSLCLLYWKTKYLAPNSTYVVAMPQQTTTVLAKHIFFALFQGPYLFPVWGRVHFFSLF